MFGVEYRVDKWNPLVSTVAVRGAFRDAVAPTTSAKTIRHHYKLGGGKKRAIHCPFHADQTPSAVVFGSGVVYCSSCNQSWAPAKVHEHLIRTGQIEQPGAETGTSGCAAPRQSRGSGKLRA